MTKKPGDRTANYKIDNVVYNIDGNLCTPSNVRILQGYKLFAGFFMHCLTKFSLKFTLFLYLSYIVHTFLNVRIYISLTIVIDVL